MSVSKASEASEETQPSGRRFREKWRSKEYRSKLLHTAWLFLSFIAMLITDTDVEQASLFFTFAAIGGLLGSIVMGISYDKFHKNRLIFICNIGMGLFVGVIPHCSQYPLMIFSWFLTGFFMRGLETGGTADVVRVWKSESRPFVFITQFGFSIGAFISPFITEPFLVPRHKLQEFSAEQQLRINCSVTDVTLTTNASQSLNGSQIISNYSNVNSSEGYLLNDNPCGFNQTAGEESLFSEINLKYAFVVSAVLAIVTSLPFLVKSFGGESHVTKTEDIACMEERQRLLPPGYYIVCIILVMFMYMCNTGIEDAFSAFLMTFVVKQMNWSKKDGALASSMFWASLITARVLGIFVADLVSPAKLILFGLVLVASSLVGLWICALHMNVVGIWAFVCLAGAAISILFPTGISITDHELIPVNGKVSAAILVAGAIGLLCNPIVLGTVMQEFSPLWFCYILFGEAILSIFIVFIIIFYGRKILKDVRNRTVVEINISNDIDAIDKLLIKDQERAQV